LTPKKLEGAISIITGAGSGIGRATAILFAREGSKVAVVDFQSKEGEQTVHIIKDNHGEAQFFEADVSDASQVKRMVASVVKAFGRIDILVNDAGINPSGTVVTTTEALWAKVIGTNLSSVYLCSKFVVPEMQKLGRGIIINLASENAFLANANEAAYDASKGGVLMLTRAMALDHAPSIRVNCLCPGVIDTPLIRGIISEQKDPEATRRMLQSTSLLGRLGKPEDVANAALFLASEDSSFITGTAIFVDGGWNAFGGNPGR
jgi:NAD(P)-dependent dehydrogenase (short-subunit alcohol dehydrogenase family)